MANKTIIKKQYNRYQEDEKYKQYNYPEPVIEQHGEGDGYYEIVKYVIQLSVDYVLHLTVYGYDFQHFRNKFKNRL